MPQKKKAAKKPAKKTPKKSSKSQEAPIEGEVTPPEEGNSSETGIVELPIVTEMQQSYLDYAMSVIVSRALPDVRDGLKPVHRRILYAMWTIGLKPGAKFRKSATVVGEVLGKYHPHGDVSVYDAMVRMAQDFAMRYQLVRGQGNFGSMDGDAPAAMRYTEAKLAPISEKVLLDIEKDTVDFAPNYDGSHQEPRVLPSVLPTFLLNGTVGIAVGMATNVPPHNLGELVDGIVHLIENPDASVKDLMKHVKGPDFPTGGIIYDKKEIEKAYATGKGSIVVRAKADLVETKSGSYNIIISEMPYQVNKAQLLIKIGELVRDKKIEGIKDLRDESNKDGVRVVVELKKEAYPKKILNQLYSQTSLQISFHVNMLALIDGIQPRVLTLKIVFEEYIKHREVVVRRRTEFDLKKAKERAHILEGLALALNKIDAVIKVIKQSKDREVAKVNLVKKFKLSEIQSLAILEMRLQQLANLERLKIETELKEKKKIIKELEAILKSKKKILSIIKEEILAVQETFNDERRTKVVAHPVGKFSTEDLIPDEPTVVMVTRDGYIKRLPPDTFKSQGRGGKGIVGQTTKEEDTVEHMFVTSTHKDLIFFTNRGRAFQLKSYEIPTASRTAKGQALVNFLQLGPSERVNAVLPLSDMDTDSKLTDFVFLTEKGVIKRVPIDQFTNIRRSGLIAIKLKPGDKLEWVKPTGAKNDCIIVTADGQSVRFPVDQLRPMGRNAAGVRGIKLKGEDHVVGLGMIPHSKESASQQVFVISERGYGKRTAVSQYRAQSRGGSGIKTASPSTKTGKLVTAFIVDPKASSEDTNNDLLIMSQKGQVIRMPLKSVSVLGRATQGVRLMRFKEKGDQVSSVALV